MGDATDSKTSTDKSATLRAMLDERGVEYEVIEPEGDDGSRFTWPCEAAGAYAEATFNSPDSECLYLEFDRLITPEQAIAATLGSGKLTAEQVSKAVYAHSIHADCADADWQAIADELNAALWGGTTGDDDGATRNEGEKMTELESCPFCGGKVGWKSGEIYCRHCNLHFRRLADFESNNKAWNTRAGERACRIEYQHGDWYCDCCGELVGTCDVTSEFCIDGNAVELWNFCPNCGAKAVKR